MTKKQGASTLILSRLAHTWLIDLDGTVVKHNGYLDGQDLILPGVVEFFKNLPEIDFVIILTARDKKYASETISFLEAHKIRFDEIIFGMPKGERVVINDVKPAGLHTAVALNVTRDSGLLDVSMAFCEDI